MYFSRIAFVAAGFGLVAGAPFSAFAAASAKEGATVYAAHCKSCHGADGEGNPAIAKMMKLTLKPLGSAEVQAKSDAELKTVSTMGSGKMKPVAGLSPADADNVVAYVRTLKK